MINRIKITLLLLTILLFIIPIEAQVQHGYVKTKGRIDNIGNTIAGKRLPGTTIKVDGHYIVSHESGNFSFPVSKNTFNVLSIRKNNYILYDRDQLRTYGYSSNPLIFVLEKPEDHNDDKLIAQQKISRTLRKQLTQRENEIERLKEEGRISRQEYQRLYNELYNDDRKNQQIVEAMAEKYASLDFDQLDDANRMIKTLILNGELPKADSLINTKGRIEARIASLETLKEVNQKEERTLKERENKLNKSKAVERQTLEDIAEDCLNKHNLYKLQCLFDSALYYIQLRANLDTLNIDWQLDASYFCHMYSLDFKLASFYGNRALSNSLLQYGRESSITAKCYCNLADLETNVDSIFMFYDKAYSIYSITKDSSAVATIYNNLGDTYRTLGDYSNANIYLTRAYELYNEINGNNNWKSAITLGNIGLVYMMQGNKKKAIEVYNKALNILNNVPDNEQKYLAEASIYIKIGSTYIDENNEEAIVYFQKALLIYKKIYPYNHPLIGEALHHIGAAYYKLGLIDDAINYFKESLDCHAKELLGHNNLGVIYLDRKEFNLAIEHFTIALEIAESTYGLKHIDVALVYENLGNAYNEQDQGLLALAFYEKALQILIEKTVDSIYINAIETKIYQTYVKLLDSNNQEINKKFQINMKPFVFTATVINQESAAAKKGLSGEYILLKYGNWSYDSMSNLFQEVSSLLLFEKDIIVMKNGEIFKFHFDKGSVGLGISIKFIGTSEKQIVEKLYGNWILKQSRK